MDYTFHQHLNSLQEVDKMHARCRSGKGSGSSRALLGDQALQHHHQATRPFAERAVRVQLQELEQLLSHLRQHRAHVVPGHRVAVVQVHHRVLQVTANMGTLNADSPPSESAATVRVN